MRTIRNFIILLLAASLILTGIAWASDGEITLSYEGEIVSLTDKSAGLAYLDSESSTVMASTAFFTEVLGAEMTYDEEKGTLSLTHGTIFLDFTLDDVNVRHNDQTTVLDAAPVLHDGTPYVPLRFTAESFDYELFWHGEEQRVDVRTANLYELGISRARMQNLYGTPTDTRESEKGYVWQVYRDDLMDYHMIGLKGDQVTAFYVMGPYWKLPQGIQSGMRLSSCSTILNSLGYQATSGTGYVTYSSEKDAVTVYYDSSTERQIYAALYEDAENLTVCEISLPVLGAMEATLADLTNVMRVQAGLEPLSYENGVADVAKGHAKDMARNNYFAHMDSNGLDKTGRMEAAGFHDFYISEVQCQAFSDSFQVFASLYLNASYREILQANFASQGIGFSYNPKSEGILYGVQLFFAEKD